MRRWRGTACYVAVVGDVTAAELGPMLDRLLGGLPDIGRQHAGPGTSWALDGGVTVDRISRRRNR